MNSERLERLKERYRYREWSRVASEQTPLDRVTLEGLSLPDWKLDHVDFVEVAGYPPAIHSVWKREARENDQALSLSLYRCPSTEAAHEFLLRLLDDFQSPQMAMVQGSGAPGDVAFAPPGEHSLLFAVANVLVLLRNAGRDLVPVAPVALAVVNHLRGLRRGLK